MALNQRRTFDEIVRAHRDQHERDLLGTVTPREPASVVADDLDHAFSTLNNILSSHTRQRGLDAYALARRGQGTLDGYRTHVGDARRDARFYADGLRSDSHVFRDLYGLAPEEVLVLERENKLEAIRAIDNFATAHFRGTVPVLTDGLLFGGFCIPQPRPRPRARQPVSITLPLSPASMLDPFDLSTDVGMPLEMPSDTGFDMGFGLGPLATVDRGDGDLGRRFRTLAFLLEMNLGRKKAFRGDEAVFGALEEFEREFARVGM